MFYSWAWFPSRILSFFPSMSTLQTRVVSRGAWISTNNSSRSSIQQIPAYISTSQQQLPRAKTKIAVTDAMQLSLRYLQSLQRTCTFLLLLSPPTEWNCSFTHLVCIQGLKKQPSTLQGHSLPCVTHSLIFKYCLVFSWAADRKTGRHLIVHHLIIHHLI